MGVIGLPVAASSAAGAVRAYRNRRSLRAALPFPLPPPLACAGASPQRRTHHGGGLRHWPAADYDLTPIPALRERLPSSAVVDADKARHNADDEATPAGETGLRLIRRRRATITPNTRGRARVQPLHARLIFLNSVYDLIGRSLVTAQDTRGAQQFVSGRQRTETVQSLRSSNKTVSQRGGAKPSPLLCTNTRDPHGMPPPMRLEFAG